MDVPPLRIECIDISHVQGTDVVASLVVFEDGLPKRSDYRRFAIRDRPGDDVASIAEVVRRRFTHGTRTAGQQADELSGLPAPASLAGAADGGTGALPADGLTGAVVDGAVHGSVVDGTAGEPIPGDPEPTYRRGIDPDTGRPRRFAYPPQLLVVDGGAPQVNAAAAVLAELGIVDVTICGLAKRLEEVWVPGDDPIIFPRTSEALYLLQRLRDEAHRFAITYHRAKRSKSMIVSALDNVPGLGDVRRKALIRHFGSVAALRKADVEEIAAVPGFGRRTAEAVVTALSAPGQEKSAGQKTAGPRELATATRRPEGGGRIDPVTRGKSPATDTVVRDAR
jgi:excinuclease ABC subunit C